MTFSEKAETADMEDGVRRLIAGSVFESLREIEDMGSVASLAIDIILEEPGQLSGNVMVKVAYQRDVMVMARQERDSLN